MNQFGIALVWCAVQVTVLSLVATVVCLALRRSSPALRSWTALLALMAIPCLTALALCPVPSWFDAGTRPAVAEFSRNRSPDAATGDPLARRAGGGAADEAARSQPHTDGQLGDFVAAFVDELTPRASTETSPAGANWPTWLAWVVVACSIFGLVHLMIGWFATHAYRTRGLPVDNRDLNELFDVTRARLNCRRQIQLLEVDGLAGAATFGLFRPVILLPRDWRTWSADERRVVLAHEVAHVVHRDYLTGLVAQLCLALHFYHPLIHWLVARLRLDQELSADAAAAAVAGGQRNYLTTLAEMALRQDDRAVLFPARMFLPTRQSFLRRIEMLRTWKVLPRRSSKVARGVAVAVLLLVVGLVAGLRSPAGGKTLLAQDSQGDSAAAAASAAFDTRYVSDDGGAIIAARPARVLYHDSLKDIRILLDKTLFRNAGEGLGFSLSDIDQVVATSDVAFRAEYQTDFFVRGTKAIDYSRLINNLSGKPLEQLPGRKYGDATIHPVADPRNPDSPLVEQRAFWMPDDRTLVYDTVRHLRRYIDGDPVSRLLLKSETWEKMSEDDVVFLADQDSLQLLLKAGRPGQGDPFTSMLVKPVIDKTRLTAVSLKLGGELRVRGVAVTRNGDDAVVVTESVNAARVLAKNMLEQLSKAGDAARDPRAKTPHENLATDPLGKKLVQLGINVLTEMKVEQEDKVTRVSTSANVDDLQLTLLAPAITAARTAAKRTQSMNNLKQIGLAFHIHHDVHKHFPGAAAVPEGKKHPVSWRVAILPYIDQEELYRQYNQDEPWDSEHNRKLIAHMPPAYRHADAPADSTSPSYFVLTGPDTIFRNDNPGIRDILDGTSNTILAVEAKRDIPWTKPEDITFDRDLATPTLGGYTPQGYNAVFADGSAKFISHAVDKEVEKHLLMSQDGNAIKNVGGAR